MKHNKKAFRIGIGALLAFAAWTILIQTVDIRPAGVNGTAIGFAAVNTWFHRLTGVHLALYTLTDWLGLVPVFVCLMFGAAGQRREFIMRNKAVVYLHGKGGASEEAAHYRKLFEDCEVIGLDYRAQSPWEAKEEFPAFFAEACQKYESVTVIANSIGAYFAMNALSDFPIERAYFISPVVNMEKLIADMMAWANVTEEELCEKKVIQTDFGEALSWEYLCYAREHPIRWNVPTEILYGEKDHLTSYETISEFASRINAAVTVLKNGEHWFHTEEQMEFLDHWLRRLI